jgi:hypothetical protein
LKSHTDFYYMGISESPEDGRVWQTRVMMLTNKV